MSGRRAYGFAGLDDISDGDSSSEDFQSSYSETDEAPPQFNIAYPHHDELSDVEEEESMDYEGRDTIQPDSEFMPPTPVHRPFSSAQNLQSFKNQLALLEMVDERNHPESSLFSAKDFIEVEEEDIDESDQQQPRDVGRDESILEEEEGGAIEVDEPFIPLIAKPTVSPVLAKPLKLKLAPFEEIPLEGFPQGYQFHKGFRAGWSPNGSLVIPRCVHYPKDKKGQDMEAEPNSSMVTTSKIQVFNNSHTTSARYPDHLAKQDFSNEIFLLQKHLLFSQKKPTRKPNELTYFTVANPDDLIKVNRKGSSSVGEKYQYDSEIWYLVEMLWGTPTGIFANDPPSSYSHQLYRRNAVGRWFSDTTSASVEADLRNLPSDLSPEEKECATIFQYLTTKKVSEAVEVALQNKDYRFAALVSQAASNNALFKKSIETQVVQWKNMKSLQAINKYRQYVYHVLSGEIEGGANEVDWKRGLALYFWYGRDVSMKYDKMDNLQLALRLYEDAFQKKNARPPIPNYLLNSINDGQNNGPEAPVYDTSYHLLQLFCHPANYPIRTVLQPKSYDEHPLNYHLSWHLHKILRAIMKDNVMDVQGPEQWNLLDYEISMNYACQLESVGHWEWALYVLLNINSPFENLKETFIQLVPQTSDSNARQHSHYPPNIGSTALVEEAFKEILSRHVPDFIEHPEKRLFLSKELLIPETWIKAAEATYQHYKKNYEAELNLLLESEQWEAAHSVLMKHLLYELLLHENSQELTRILDALCLHQTQLQEWPSKGGLFLDYLKLVTKCTLLIPTTSKKQDEDLLRELNNAMKKIQVWNSNNSFNSENNLLREACIGEMSSVIHNHIAMISKKHSVNGFNVGHIELQALPNDLVKHHLEISLNQFLQKRI
jgi:hypothetical protein